MKQLFIYLSMCLPLGLFAQEMSGDPGKMKDAEEMASPSVQQEAVGFLGYDEMRVVSLAEAIPEDNYDWRPQEGVRSIREVLLHIAGANYFFMKTAGFELPEGINPMEFEKSVMGKENIIETVKGSYAFIKEKIGAIGDDQLGDKVEFPWEGDHTKMTAILLSVGHNGEHLGQLIAYARTNGVTPPWSEGAQADGE